LDSGRRMHSLRGRRQLSLQSPPLGRLRSEQPSSGRRPFGAARSHPFAFTPGTWTILRSGCEPRGIQPGRARCGCATEGFALVARYRRPYTARHSSVSWNLMIGRNPLWVAKQHGHSIATMLRVYAAWADGAIESDIEAIKRSMDQATAAVPVSARIRECCRYGRHSMRREGIAPVSRNLAVDLSLAAIPKSQVTERNRKGLAEREGFRAGLYSLGLP
jgi:hypothetical protein